MAGVVLEGAGSADRGVGPGWGAVLWDRALVQVAVSLLASPECLTAANTMQARLCERK